VTFSQRICKCQKLHKTSLSEADRIATTQHLFPTCEAGCGFFRSVVRNCENCTGRGGEEEEEKGGGERKGRGGE
jgi:hypothetical protein